jgi:hypothetical protein
MPFDKQCQRNHPRNGRNCGIDPAAAVDRPIVIGRATPPLRKQDRRGANFILRSNLDDMLILL